MTTIKKTAIFRKNLLGNNQVSEDGNLYQEIYYDEKGHEVEKVNYDSRGKVEEKVRTKIVDGLIAEEELELNGEVSEKIVKEYDEKGRVKSETKYYTEGGHDITTFHHENDHLVLKQVIDSDGEEGEKQIWEYEEGKLIKESSYNIFGNIDVEKLYSYDEDGELAEVTEVFFDDDNSERLVSLIEKGRVVMEKKYNSKDKLVARNRITYDDHGRTILIEEENTKGTKNTRFEYDDKGNNISQTELDESGEVIRHVDRSFDDEGRVLSVEVMVQPDNYNPGQHYVLIYKHEL
jgi:antitoxin component YwqK of YwqJK toxin-antitoxin module